MTGMIGALRGVARQDVVLFVQTAQQRLQRLSAICSDHVGPHQFEHHIFISDITEHKKQRSSGSSVKRVHPYKAILHVKTTTMLWAFY